MDVYFKISKEKRNSCLILGVYRRKKDKSVQI